MRGLATIFIFAMCASARASDRPAFQTLRYNEDWTYLRDASNRTDWLDPVKFVPLDGTNVYFSFGGEARLMAMHFRSGRPDKAIVQLAREIGADVIVVATQPTTGLVRLLGGSVADRITRNAPCPVVVVRPKVDEDDPGLAEYPPRA